MAGHRTGAGNPTWLAGAEATTRSASAVARLVRAGATCVAKTHTDEFAYSLSGINAHYATPINPAAPGRTPGGSSSGSAAAVAGGLVPFALGTDTGGSVPVPASYCGLVRLPPYSWGGRGGRSCAPGPQFRHRRMAGRLAGDGAPGRRRPAASRHGRCTEAAGALAGDAGRGKRGRRRRRGGRGPPLGANCSGSLSSHLTCRPPLWTTGYRCSARCSPSKRMPRSGNGSRLTPAP